MHERPPAAACGGGCGRRSPRCLLAAACDAALRRRPAAAAFVDVFIAIRSKPLLAFARAAHLRSRAPLTTRAPSASPRCSSPARAFGAAHHVRFLCAPQRPPPRRTVAYASASKSLLKPFVAHGPHLRPPCGRLRRRPALTLPRHGVCSNHSSLALLTCSTQRGVQELTV